MAHIDTKKKEKKGGLERERDGMIGAIVKMQMHNKELKQLKADKSLLATIHKKKTHHLHAENQQMKLSTSASIERRKKSLCHRWWWRWGTT